MTYRHGQILIHALHAMRNHAELVSGAYKARWRDHADDEKRDRVLAEMKRHIGFVSDCCESLPGDDDA